MDVFCEHAKPLPLEADLILAPSATSTIDQFPGVPGPGGYNRNISKELHIIFHHVALGLDALHKDRYIHRDIKPCNLGWRLGADNSVAGSALDLGLATKEVPNVEWGMGTEG